MDWSPLPPATAAAVALAISLTRSVTTVAVGTPIDVPGQGALTLYRLGGRAVGFVLVYGLLLGVAYRVGRRGDALDVGPTALATGLVGGVSFLLGTGAVLAWIGPQNVIVVVGTVGTAVGVGVELAVVALAGLSLGRLRTTG